MKLTTLCAALAILASASASTVTPTYVEALITDAPVLEKRAKDVIVNKDYAQLQKLKEGGQSSAAPLKPWHRTIYSTKVEIVTPTVIGGVTFSAKPPATTDGLEPWISLNKEGSPKTIRPKMKNGVIKNASPTYGTYFQTATTITYLKEELKAHNMKDGEVYEHEEFLPEDLTYQLLNPIFRCTPASYKNKGVGKNLSPEPFCFPQDNTQLLKDKTYFVTWYHRFFDDSVDKVKVHFSYVKEAARQKGLRKRSEVIQKGGTLAQKSFHSSEWLPKETGIFPITIDEEWLGGEYYRKVVISLQPDNIEDDDFDFLEHSVVVEFGQGVKVAKGHLEDIKLAEERARLRAQGIELDEGLDYEKYMIMMTMPTCVLLAALAMYFFVWINRKNTDLSFLRKVKLNRKKGMKVPFKRNSKYSELPQWEGPKAD